MEEASSVIKAIEKGWVQADKPQEFTVKVFEVEEKNFLGMTSKPAKIALFYKEAIPVATKQPQQRKPQYPAPNNRDIQRDERKSEKTNRQQPRHPIIKEANAEKKAPEKREPVWTPDMIQHTQQWITETLSSLGKPNIASTTEVKNYYLKITFAVPLLADQNKERLLFKSFAHLIIQALRNKFKKSFKGFKIILLSPTSDIIAHQ